MQRTSWRPVLPPSQDNQNLATLRDEQCFPGYFDPSGLFADQIVYWLLLVFIDLY